MSGTGTRVAAEDGDAEEDAASAVEMVELRRASGGASAGGGQNASRGGSVGLDPQRHHHDHHRSSPLHQGRGRSRHHSENDHHHHHHRRTGRRARAEEEEEEKPRASGRRRRRRERQEEDEEEEEAEAEVEEEEEADQSSEQEEEDERAAKGRDRRRRRSRHRKHQHQHHQQEEEDALPSRRGRRHGAKDEDEEEEVEEKQQKKEKGGGGGGATQPAALTPGSRGGAAATTTNRRRRSSMPVAMHEHDAPPHHHHPHHHNHYMARAGRSSLDTATAVVAAAQQHENSRPSLNLFRTAADERGPSRTRAKAVDAGGHVTFSTDTRIRPSSEQRRIRSPPVPARVERQHSDHSVDSADGQRSSAKKRRKGTSAWHASHNPLFRADEREVEMVPLHIWIYAVILKKLWPPLNFFRLHFIYICTCALIAGVILHLTQLGTANELEFTDSLFHGVSSVTNTGLITTDTAKITTVGQIVLAFAMLAGNFQLLTLVPVVVRLYYFRKHFREQKLSQRSSDEYYALIQLFVIVLLYFCAVSGTGWILFSIYLSADGDAKDVLDRNGVNVGWYSLFQTISAMSNTGYAILYDSMVQWQTYPFPLLLTSFLILAGNTAWPIMLRLIIRILYHQPFIRRWKHVYKYMLDHPRRCYTHLFPPAETRWLVTVLFLLNTIEFIFEVVLDWHNPSYTQLNSGEKIVNMYFQTISIRTAGFNSIDVTKLPVAILWLYIGMMYISATPVAITVRYTGNQISENIEAEENRSRHTNTVGSQAQTIFVRHVVFLFMAVLFICMIEEVPLRVDPQFSLLKIIFEVMSAYGPVGLSLGYGSDANSFSGAFSTGSKLIIMVLMILGKHRNLPNSIDSAIAIPSADVLEAGDTDDMIEIVEDSTYDEEDYSSSADSRGRRKRSRTGQHIFASSDSEGGEDVEKDYDVEMGQLAWSDSDLM